MSQTQSFPDLHNPEEMFKQALDYQERVTALQEDIVKTITDLRVQLSGILKSTSNATLAQVQDNIWKIFELDEPVRKLTFVDNPRTTDCILNLRTQLNMHTEFSGFSSSNCLLRYNRNVDERLDEAYGTLAEYEGLISIVQLLVVRSFNGKNIWTRPEEIVEIIQKEYDTHKTKWDGDKASINNFLSTLERDIGAYNTVLGGCFTDLQASLVGHYQYITNNVQVCNEFDNLN